MTSEERRDAEVEAHIQAGFEEAGRYQSVADLDAALSNPHSPSWRALIAWIAAVGPADQQAKAVPLVNRIAHDHQVQVFDYLGRRSLNPAVRDEAKRMLALLHKKGMADPMSMPGWWTGV
jgi:hypothetical protein